MPVSHTFLEFVLEQLDPVGPINSKRMFGGVGIYARDLFFALLANDVIYLKADDSTRGEIEGAGGRPFQPYPDRAGTMQYYSVPVAILEDNDELVRWARTSIAVAKQQRAMRPASAKPSKLRARPKPLTSAEKLAARRKASRRPKR